MNRKQKKLLLLFIAIAALFLFTGCQNNIDPQTNKTYADKIIYLSTSWGSIISSDGLFTAIFVYPLAQCINFISQYTGVVVGVVVTTIILNMITFGFSVKSTVSSQKMQMLQPEMAKLQAKYEGKTDDASKMRQAQEMQALYAKHDIKPFSSLLIPFLQLPIMLAMYYAVQRSIAVCDGKIGDALLSETPMYGLQHGFIILFVIYVLMGVAQFASTKLPSYLAEKKAKAKKKSYDNSEKNPGASSKLMIYGMLVMILVLAINWPTAMSLYWLVSSTINVIKTLYIQRKYIDNEKA